MNERDFQQWLAAQAPAHAPDALRDRIAAISASAASEPRRAGSMRQGRARGRRTLAVALLAAALGASAVALGSGSIVPPQDRAIPDPSADLRARHNGVIALSSQGVTYVVDPVTGREVVGATPGVGLLASRDRVLVTTAYDLAWSPDGRSLAYTTRSGVHVVDIFTGERTLDISLGGCALTFECFVGWSPDGRRLAVTEFEKVHVIDLEAERLMTIATLPGDGPASPSWSPDGEWIAYAVRPHLYRLRPDGSELTRILTDDGLGPVDPTWTPDGKRIAYVSIEPSSGEGSNLAIVSVEPDGSDRRQIAHIGSCFCLGWWPPGLAWSPDGTQITFVTLNFGLKADADTQPSGDATGGLYVAFANGGQPRQLLSGVRGSPAWQPVP